MHNPFESLSLRSSARPAAPQLEDYLFRLCVPLSGRLTYEQRLAIQEEVRSHILVLATAHEELGLSSTEALLAAMQQFGEPTSIGRSLSREYRKPLALSDPLRWQLLHGLIGGAVGAIALATTDCMLQQTHLVSYTALPFDCLVGMAIGWIPALQLLRRPTSPLKAGFLTGGFYLALTTGMMILLSMVNRPGGLDSHGLQIVLNAIASMTLQGAIGGAVMSPLFEYLQRFAPSSQPKIAS